VPEGDLEAFLGSLAMAGGRAIGAGRLSISLVPPRHWSAIGRADGWRRIRSLLLPWASKRGAERGREPETER